MNDQTQMEKLFGGPPTIDADSAAAYESDHALTVAAGQTEDQLQVCRELAESAADEVSGW